MSNISINNETSSILLVAKPVASLTVTGVTGGGGDAFYEHIQLDPEAVWTITHNLGKKPAITVVDSADTVVIGEVEYIDNNSVQLTFAAAFSGKAYFN
jgi:hypothetical protein